MKCLLAPLALALIAMPLSAEDKPPPPANDAHRFPVQAEAYPWGGLRGLRLDGERVGFTTGIRAVQTADQPGALFLGKRDDEKLTWPHYTREGRKQILTGSVVLDPKMPRQVGAGITAGPEPNTRIVYDDSAAAAATVDIAITSPAAAKILGVYYYFHFLRAEFPDLKVEPTHVLGTGAGAGEAGFRAIGTRRQIVVTFDSPRPVTLFERRDGLDVCFPVTAGELAAGAAVNAHFTIALTGEVDRAPATVTLQPERLGSPFAGIGGNFRIQNRVLDPPQVEYYLNHLRVTWARVNVPLNFWQQTEDADPLTDAAAGRMHDYVRVVVDMTRRLAERKIPLVLSVWTAPDWALGPLVDRPPGGGGGQTRHIDPAKWEKVMRSMGAYLEYLKRTYGVEAEYFSFNETDIGYDILQTPQEHAHAIRSFGEYLAAHGFRTKMMLGDTGDPTGIDFIDVAMADPEAVRSIGAVSYHAWRGGTDEQHRRWGAAAKTLNVPLLIGEGGIDADAYRYPTLLLEPWYGLVEIGEYVHLCRLAQPRSILQWQLTENYSLLRGGRGGEPLAPAQRFWNLQQLGQTPPNARAIELECDRSPLQTCAYLADSGTIAVHIVNDGAARPVVIKGLPAAVKSLRVLVTDADRGAAELAVINAKSGAVEFTAPPMSFTTLLSQ